MPLEWFSVVVDCDDPDLLAEFWCQVLGFNVVYRSEDIVDMGCDVAACPVSSPIRGLRLSLW